MEITREIEIARAVDDVFAFVADPLNDPRWCPKVKSVEQAEGDGPGAGSVYAVVHKPVPGRPPRQMTMTWVASSPPRRIELREDDGTDVFNVTYELEPTASGTRLRQRSVAALGAPRLLHPLFRHGIGRDLAGQLKRLKRVLET